MTDTDAEKCALSQETHKVTFLLLLPSLMVTVEQKSLAHSFIVPWCVIGT